MDDLTDEEAAIAFQVDVLMKVSGILTSDQLVEREELRDQCGHRLLNREATYPFCPICQSYPDRTTRPFRDPLGVPRIRNI